ncbi:Imm49 family immunity protein [Candidatus Bodocaedibacter vickermanii]|uniref:Uncharacterized protein n=1 Tax=Candidatus Bodocaedibacter vickermanii TaxID=2741701 RepID=A0A7L9RSB0_9PROT|nr:hypothetical protein CPBP_00210 [Candidatus Paracaedibacteraceae bacterium 'Lake Konstanz']
MKLPTPQEQYERYQKKIIPEYFMDMESENVSKRLNSLHGLYSGYKFLGILEWYLHKDSKKFKEYMKTAVEYDKDSFLYSKEIRPSNKTSTACLSAMFDALNSGNEDLVKSYFTMVDDYYDYDTKPTSHPANWLYRCLVVLALNRYENQWSVFIEKLKKGYSTKQYGKLYPLALMLEAIWNKDEMVFNEQAQIFADSYKSMTRGIFPDYEDKLLSLWGLGICNLAEMKGLKVTIDHQYLPKELIG